MRRSGLDIVGDIPWGFHFGVAYNNVSEFRDILIPYLNAGLENNELCTVIASDAFTKDDCEKMVKEGIANFSKCYKSGQLEIVPYTEWYLQNGKFNKKWAINSARTRLAALKKFGYEGLRIFGESSWIKRTQLPKVISYEKEVQKRIGQTRIIALCGYLTKDFSAHEVLRIVCVHDNILAKENGAWTLIKCLKNQSMQAELQKLKQIISGVSGTADNHGRNEDLIKTIREQIRSTRKTMGLTQAEIANRVDISPNFLGLIERGERTPSFKTMSRIASALGLNLKELVGEIKPVPKEKSDMTEKIEGYLEGCSAHEKKLIYGFVRMLIKERAG